MSKTLEGVELPVHGLNFTTKPINFELYVIPETETDLKVPAILLLKSMEDQIITANALMDNALEIAKRLKKHSDLISPDACIDEDGETVAQFLNRLTGIIQDTKVKQSGAEQNEPDLSNVVSSVTEVAPNGEEVTFHISSDNTVTAVCDAKPAPELVEYITARAHSILDALDNSSGTTH